MFSMLLIGGCGSFALSTDRRGAAVLNVPVPMRDGAVLRANLYLPSLPGPFPVLVFRTPYSKDEGDADNEETFRSAVKRGYAVLVQDVRGRFASDGIYNPYRNEGKDGYDTIEWAAVQPWSNGSVGMFGLSYPAAVQWLAAVENPPHLKAIAPAMCFSSMSQFIYFGGVFETEWISWAYKNMSPDARARLGLPGPRTVAEAGREYDRLGRDTLQGWLPLLDLPYLKDTCPWYYDWLTNAPYSAYWDFANLHDKYGRVQCAVLNLSGWYDEPYGPEGAGANYLGLVASRKDWPDPKTRLVIGPWIHGVDAVKSHASGDRRFASRAARDYDGLILEFMDEYVKGITKGPADSHPVEVYLMGSERWVRSGTWPLPKTSFMPMYLARGSGASRIGHLVWQAPQDQTSLSYRSDPGNPIRDDAGTNFGAYDLRWLTGRGDTLTFDSAPVEKDLAVLGPIEAEIFLSADVPDCDLFVKLLDVAPDGTAFNLMSPGAEVRRVSYRNQTAQRQPMNPGEVTRLHFSNLRTGNTFLKGHRLRVVLCSSWFPIYARNLQTGHSETSGSTYRPGTITVHLGGSTPSRIVLPVAPDE
jgi:putative CocE/NonD family hydrolase